MTPPIPYLLLSILLCLFSCGNEDRQNIDLSDQVVTKPVDGVGHYVYALTIPKTVAPGEKFDVQMEWRTVGSVDPNARYTMEAILTGPKAKVYSLPSGANTVGELHLANWLSYDFLVPEDFPAGEYAFGVRLLDEVGDGGDVPLGFVPEMEITDGYYRLANIAVGPATD
ncbi:hypothetical protein [Lewinella sp. IMCC34191]|uniref:hypothetical protein n=1 Tax=Lewinella sp. IMCC34191 TaxID=2259172 RepID=UPI00130064B8|nr:hypothetical protein [Lewinella sp. IMCC34191]